MDVIYRYVSKRFVLFILVGIFNTFFGYAIYSYLVFLGYKYDFISKTQLILGILFNYLAYGKLVFKKAGFVIFVKFAAYYLVWYLMYNYGLFLLDKYKVNPYLAGLIMIVPMTLVSYAIQNIMIFRTNKK